MNPETTLPLDLAPLREGAEEMAREHFERFSRVRLGHAYTMDEAVSVFVALLSDLTRPASRDWWVRWLAARNRDEIRRVWVSRCAGSTTPDSVRDQWIREDIASDRLHMDRLRDNPEALRAAIFAALETR